MRNNPVKPVKPKIKFGIRICIPWTHLTSDKTSQDLYTALYSEEEEEGEEEEGEEEKGDSQQLVRIEVWCFCSYEIETLAFLSWALLSGKAPSNCMSGNEWVTSRHVPVTFQESTLDVCTPEATGMST